MLNRTRAGFGAAVAGLLLAMLSIPVAAQAEDPAPQPVSGICHDSNDHFVPCVPKGYCQDEDGVYQPACISDLPPCNETVGEPCLNEWYIVFPDQSRLTATIRRQQQIIDMQETAIRRLQDAVAAKDARIQRQVSRIQRQAKTIRQLRAEVRRLR